MQVHLYSAFEEIQQLLPKCNEFAHKVSANIPFQYMQMPLLWWTHFNNTDGTLFSMKRGKNILGVQSRLTNLYLVTAEENNQICGVVPLASYVAKLPNNQDDFRILTFAGDYVTSTCQDFLVDPNKRADTINAILTKIMKVFSQNHDLINFGYIPEQSYNLPHIRLFLSSKNSYCAQYIEAFTAKKGGVWPWTIDPLCKLFDSLLTKLNKDYFYYNEIEALSGKLSGSSRLMTLFPKNRSEIFQQIKAIIPLIEHTEFLDDEFKILNKIINPSIITYPYISLPYDREKYIDSLSKSKKYYFKRYLKKYLDSGGIFEKLSGNNIKESDIDDCFRLHQMRWGKESAILSSDQSIRYNREIVMSMAQEGMFSLFFSTIDGERIATHSCFDIRNRREFYIPGRNPKYEKLRAGSLLAMETILDAIDHNFEIYDLGVEGFDYKMDFTKNSYTTKNFFVFKENSFIPEFDMIYNGFEYMIA